MQCDLSLLVSTANDALLHLSQLSTRWKNLANYQLDVNLLRTPEVATPSQPGEENRGGARPQEVNIWGLSCLSPAAGSTLQSCAAMCGGSANIGGASPGSGRCAINLPGFHGIVTVQCIELIVTIIAVGFPSITTGTLYNVKFTILHIPSITTGTLYNTHILNNHNTTLHRYHSWNV